MRYRPTAGESCLEKHWLRSTVPGPLTFDQVVVIGQRPFTTSFATRSLAAMRRRGLRLLELVGGGSIHTPSAERFCRGAPSSPLCRLRSRRVGALADLHAPRSTMPPF